MGRVAGGGNLTSAAAARPQTYSQTLSDRYPIHAPFLAIMRPSIALQLRHAGTDLRYW
jgi:hypothetical protein